MFLPLEHFHATHESFLFGFALIVTEHELLIFFSRPVMMCGCVCPVAITVLHRDRSRQRRRIYPGDVRASIGSLLGSLIVVVFGQHYLQALSMGLAGYFVAQRASDLSIFLTGN